jgi:hypothetical protein
LQCQIDDLVVAIGKRCPECLFLVAEIVIQGALREPAGPGHDDHRQPAVTMVEKCLVDPVQQVTSRLDHGLRHQIPGYAVRQRDRKRVEPE